MAADWIGIIEAAYVPAPDERTWIERILDAARPALDRGLGVAGLTYDASRFPVCKARTVVALGAPPVFRAALGAMLEGTSPEHKARILRSVCATSSELASGLPRDREVLARATPALGSRDALVVHAGDPSGTGLLLAAPLPAITRVARSLSTAWSRVAPHLAAGHRLVCLSAEGASPSEPFAAVEALREGAVAMIRASADPRHLPEAVAAWRALVAGRWSLLDRFDRDGRHFVVARRNHPEARVLAGLTLRERQIVDRACLGCSNKLIGYELGISPTSVSTHLGRVSAKLGVGSRAALIEVCMGLSSGRREGPAR